MFRAKRLTLVSIAAAALPLLVVGNAMAGGAFGPPPFLDGIKVTGPAINATVVMDAHDGTSFPNRDDGFTPAQASIRLDKGNLRSGAVFTIPAPETFFNKYGCDATLTEGRFVTTASSWIPLDMWIPPAILPQIFSDLGITISGSLIPIITHVDNPVCTLDPTNPGPDPSAEPYPGTLSFDATIQFAIPQ